MLYTVNYWETMVFGRMTIDDTRAACKEKIEALEFWLRRLIDLRFKALYGPDYFNAVDATGAPLFSSKVRSHAHDMLNAHPGRYQRPVDTLLLEEEARTICKFFSEFREAFVGTAHNREAAQRLFERIVVVRNPLYHANPITLRQAEQAFCYSNDILKSLQDFYRKQAMAYLYDAPLIIRMSDSLGNVRHRAAGTEIQDFNHGYMSDEASYLRVGDLLTVEVEVDPAYPPESYDIHWRSTLLELNEYGMGPSFQVKLTERQVAAHFDIQCSIISKKTWHRKGNKDDFMLVSYRVLPDA